MALFGSGPTWAQDTAGDAEAGHEVAHMCQNCHGVAGDEGGLRTPRIGGQPAAYLAEQLRAFHSGERESANRTMSLVAKILKDEQIEQGPSSRIPLPDLIPDVIAGAPAPRKLTAWNIKAIRITVTLEREGRVVRDDFKHHKVDIRRWIAPGSRWLVRNGEGWSRGPGLPDFQT
ncbi:MAG TPA: hypothetical protein VM899_12990, partial [Rubellimicrobium sp.]|nr:hypothetical protein [Rubellimicrobium sp.]